MKKFQALFLISALALAVGCSQPTDAGTGATDTKAPAATDGTTPSAPTEPGKSPDAGPTAGDAAAGGAAAGTPTPGTPAPGAPTPAPGDADKGK